MLLRVESSRAAVYRAAWSLDAASDDAARLVATAKAYAGSSARYVCGEAIQMHGAAGVSQDFPLAEMYTAARTLRLADGPDEVHRLVVARAELARYRERSG